MRVRRYALMEIGPLVWIWLGTEPADASTIPDVWWLDDPNWAYGSGNMSIDSNYVALHENLLDLTHFTFLHPGNIGTPEYASAPYTVTTSANVVTVERFVADCAVPEIYQATGLGTKRISRRAISEFISPGLHSARAELTDLSAQPDARDLFTVRVTHFVTPWDINRTHYFFAIARNFAVADETATAAMQAGALKAFREDAVALEAIARMQRSEPDFTELSMKSDQAGVTMRRIVKVLSERESAAN